ncbi:MAG: hypothetical protein HWN81_01160 [Candidatus Lokiarchaeota archaeon]|nr:hypothetical protein [Candidatus Lokiarchaeota archaeon]
MDSQEEKKIIEEIMSQRRLSYSIEVLDIQGDKYTIRNNFGSSMIYVKKGEYFLLEGELE